MRFINFVLILTIASTTHIYSQSVLEQNFKNPPIESRPKGLWDWVNGNFSYNQIKYELKESYDKGMGGFDIWDVGGKADEKNMMPEGPAFLSDESADAIAFTVREAKKYNLEIGLISSSSWNDGGSWVQPIDGVFGIYKTEIKIKGGEKVNIKLPNPQLEKNYGGFSSKDRNEINYKKILKDVKIIAKRPKDKSIDITEFVDSTSTLLWDAPEGSWTITRYVAASTGQQLVVPSPNSNGLMIDHFSATAQKNNLNYIIGKLTPRLGADLGKAGLSYLYVDSYELKGAAWSLELPAEFKKRRGYDMMPYISILFGDQTFGDDTTKRFMYDYKRTLSDMIIENHYLLGRQICEQYGTGYVAEAAGPGEPVHNCPFESLRSSGVLTKPRGEFWLGMEKRTDKDGNSNLDMIKGVACASHIYNQKYVEAESFTTVPMYKEDFNALKKAADNAFCDGLNKIVLHTYQHNVPESGKPGYNYPFGTVFGTFQPWWQLSKGFFDYLSRVSYLLQEGNFVGDVLFYYGDQAPNFVKENTYRKLTGPGYDYDVTNSDILLNKLSVKDSKLVLPHGQEYRILVLPNSKEMPLEVMKKIEQLVANGAVVVGNKPSKVPYLQNFSAHEAELNKLAAKVWGMCDGKKIRETAYGKGKIYCGLSVDEVLTKLNVAKDANFTSTQDTSKIKYIHRLTQQGEHIYFISNQAKKADRFDAAFRVTGLEPELWDLNSGNITVQKYYSTKDGITILPMSLPVNGSVAIIFRKKTATIGNLSTYIYNENNEPIFPLQKGKTKFSKEIFPKGIYNVSVNGIANTFSINTSTVSLKAPWDVRFPFGFDAPVYNTFTGLNSWTESKNDGIKYFSGTATYSNTFELNNTDPSKQAILEFEEIRDMAEIWLNGQRAGFVWAFPYQIDVTGMLRSGKNTIVIDVANGINNRRVGDANESNPRKFTFSNIDKGNCAWCDDWKKVSLMPSGIIGDVKITFSETK